MISAPPTAPCAPPANATLDALAHAMADGALDPRQLGALGEQYAAAWLEHDGCLILDRNWRSRYGELDVVALSPGRVVLFVEVKTRRGVRYGTPQEAVTVRKQTRLRRAGLLWLATFGRRIAHRGTRFDVMAITAPVGAQATATLIEGAF